MIPEKMKARQRINKSPLLKGNIYAVTIKVEDRDGNQRDGPLITPPFCCGGAILHPWLWITPWVVVKTSLDMLLWVGMAVFYHNFQFFYEKRTKTHLKNLKMPWWFWNGMIKNLCFDHNKWSRCNKMISAYFILYEGILIYIANHFIVYFIFAIF